MYVELKWCLMIYRHIYGIKGQFPILFYQRERETDISTGREGQTEGETDTERNSNEERHTERDRKKDRQKERKTYRETQKGSTLLRFLWFFKVSRVQF